MVNVKIENEEFDWKKTGEKFLEGFIYGALGSAVIALESGIITPKSFILPVVVGGLKGGLNVIKNWEKIKK